MVVCFCPACGKKVYIKAVADGQYPVDFKHCWHEITITEEKKKKKIESRPRFGVVAVYPFEPLRTLLQVLSGAQPFLFLGKRDVVDFTSDTQPTLPRRP